MTIEFAVEDACRELWLAERARQHAQKNHRKLDLYLLDCRTSRERLASVYAEALRLAYEASLGKCGDQS